MFLDWFKRSRAADPAEAPGAEQQPHPNTPHDTSSPGGGTALAASAPPPLDVPLEVVAQRAYEIWCRRGRPGDTQVPDWLAAEAELRAEMGIKPPQ